jgi:hypothetical protein
MNKKEFKAKYFHHSFYWVKADVFEELQRIAIEMGLTWHTGDTDSLKWIGQRNLCMFDGYFQQCDMWIRGAKYGDPVDFTEMKAAYDNLTNK